MKNVNVRLSILAVLITLFSLNAQSQEDLPTVTILDVETSGFNLSPEQMGNIVRTELLKLKVLDVMDPYDVAYLMEKENIEVKDCYGKMCLTEVGRKIKTDKMLSGNVRVYGKSIVVNLKMIDVGMGAVELNQVEEFLNLRNEVSTMVEITLRKMFNLDYDPDVYKTLTKKFDYENAINTPESQHLNASGPRMGMMLMMGELGKAFTDPTEMGGYDMYPLMFQFGYQFEVKYLNQGDFQALFEFVPIISGLDQGKFIPSISLLNGMRSNRSGLEFAFGPIFYTTKVAEGYYVNGNWVLKNDYDHTPNDPFPKLEERPDSRGDVTLATRFVFSVGKTFKSGNLNLPVNAFFIPSKDGHRIGLSFGYNASKR
ncbi:MAG: hypothetical protein R2879_11905 [Saprospiraceae bacterium]